MYLMRMPPHPGFLPGKAHSAPSPKAPFLPPGHDSRPLPGLGRPGQATAGHALGLLSKSKKHPDELVLAEPSGSWVSEAPTRVTLPLLPLSSGLREAQITTTAILIL